MSNYDWTVKDLHVAVVNLGGGMVIWNGVLFKSTDYGLVIGEDEFIDAAERQSVDMRLMALHNPSYVESVMEACDCLHNHFVEVTKKAALQLANQQANVYNIDAYRNFMRGL